MGNKLSPEALREKIRGLPDRPGVYLMHDDQGEVLYVGKAKSLKKRVGSYFRRQDYASPRLRRLVASIADISVIRTESEVEALIVEARLIKKYQPFFNVELKMGERYPFVKITKERFPRILITRHREEDGGIYFGPFTRVAEVRQLLRLSERYFPLRQCAREIDPGAPEARPCVRHALGRCLGPCAGLCSEGAYAERVADLVLLLSGKTADLVERLRRRMDRAAQEMAFEEAAHLRDMIRGLWHYTRQRTSLAGHNTLDGETWQVLRQLQELLGLKTLPWRIDGFDISHFSGKETYGVAVVFEQGAPNPSLYRRFVVKSLDGAVDDFRAMEEVVARRYRRVVQGQEPAPQLILIDGGPQQLAFALEALRGAGLGDIPMVALAERNEEIYRPDEAVPMRLERSDRALHLLQRVRDEAHRFAVSSHRRGRDVRLRRSALEDIPGVGKKRAAALLGALGSPARIAATDSADLARIPGIGPGLAKRILEGLWRAMDLPRNEGKEDKGSPPSGEGLPSGGGEDGKEGPA